MSFIKQTLRLLSCLSFLSIGFVADFAVAQCVQADVSIQYNISGSKEPSDRNNQVDMQSYPGCQGNASVTTGVQGNEGGTGRVRQNRIIRHRFADDNNSSYGLGGDTIQIRSNAAIDVYNPADRLSY